jgi:tetratricopeptide (TPR) repeat protein
MAQSPVQVWEDFMVIPTSVEGLPDPNPPFDLFNTTRFYNYPYTLRNNLVDRREPKKWRTLNLENEYLKCTVLPDLGGHLYTCIDKINGASMFYANPSVKLARIAYRGMWAALGIEFNFPVSHNWMTVSPVDYAMTSEPDGSASIWVGNIDRVYGMQWRVQLTLRPGQASLEQRTTLYNRSDVRHRFYWWTNAGVEVWDDSRILYPMQFTAGHGFADIDTWPVDSLGVDLSVVGNQTSGWVSRFSYGSREPYMAVYHPRTQAGVVHYSSPLDLPAKKIWSWGKDEDGLDWRNALSDNGSAYVEIQAGLFRDQETYGFLEPQEMVSFAETWIPIRDLGGVSRATPDAVLNLTRENSKDVEGHATLVATLNVTREIPNASITLLDGQRVLSSDRVSPVPAKTLHKTFPGLPAAPAYTLELRDEAGTVLLRQTEGVYDFIAKDKVKTGKQGSHAFPSEKEFSEDDFVALGTMQERNGELLVAHATYLKGLHSSPESLALNRAAGRLEVALAQYQAASDHLAKVLSRVSNDYEAAYYRGLALSAMNNSGEARRLWEGAQHFGQFQSPALFSLAAEEARNGNLGESLLVIEKAPHAHSGLVRLGGMEIALLRSLQRTDEAKKQLVRWRMDDPTSSLVRYEAVLLGATDPKLFAHLAGDPERILEIASDYIRFGLYRDALELLARNYPSGPEVVSEPGTLPPASYPLIAYYRGYCRQALGEDGRPDFEAASRMPTVYVFPSRPELFAVLQQALAANSQDATAHFFLGSLYLSGGMTDPAMAEWEQARRIKPEIPMLQRNIGYTLLRSGGSPAQAIDVFREGIRYDPNNVDLYLGLDEAMAKTNHSAAERAKVLTSFPDLQIAPAALVFRLVHLLAEAGEFDQAEAQLANHFFPREEGAVNVRQVYVDLRLKRASTLALGGQCKEAIQVVDHLGDHDARLPFTAVGMRLFVTAEATKESIDRIKAACRPPSSR